MWLCPPIAEPELGFGDPLIFRQAIKEFSLDPEETIYVDDLEDNVRVASEAGFTAVRYDLAAHGAFLAEVRALGLELPEG